MCKDYEYTAVSCLISSNITWQLTVLFCYFSSFLPSIFLSIIRPQFYLNTFSISMITFQILFAAEPRKVLDYVSFLYIYFVTRVKNWPPLLIWFSLSLWISHPVHFRSSVECLIIKFSIWSQLSTHFQAYFIFLNICLMETSDLLKCDLVHSSPTTQLSEGYFLLLLSLDFFSFFHLSTMWGPLFLGHTSCWFLSLSWQKCFSDGILGKKGRESQIFYTLKV